MTKLYYDNAIDALYMAEKFGVKFYINSDEHGKLNVIEFSVASGSEDSKGRALILHCTKNPQDERYKGYLFSECSFELYITTESLDIFEPKERDILTFQHPHDAGHGDFYTQEVVERMPKIRNLSYAEEVKIIQRNNTPFIMPKSEDES